MTKLENTDIFLNLYNVINYNCVQETIDIRDVFNLTM